MTEKATTGAGRFRFGFIGLGNMGAPMAKRLLEAGFELTIWNRTAAKAAPLLDAGANPARHPADVMRRAEIVGLCLSSGAAVQAAALGAEGLIQGAQGSSGKLVLDFTSMDPYATRELHDKVRSEAGLGWIDAPVSGGVPAAEQGNLIVFAGGREEEIEKARPFLDPLSKRVMHMGPSGAGQLTKACNQLIVGVNFLAIAEAFAFARRAGVKVEELTAALSGGFADSKPLQLFGPKMARHAFEPKQGGIDLMIKDMDTVHQIAQRTGAATPLASLAAALYRSVGTRPDGDLKADISAIINIFE